MVVQAPDGVPTITGNEDIFGLRTEDYILELRMRLEEAAMFLRFEQLTGGLWWNRSKIEPWRRHVDGRFFGTEEDKLGDDLLRPGRSRFAPTCNDDVVGALFRKKGRSQRIISDTMGAIPLALTKGKSFHLVESMW